MSEHFERHRSDVERLVALAAEDGVAITPERAYRAWSRHSDSMAAGWMTLREEDGFTGTILRAELASLEVEDIGAGVAHRGDVDDLVAKCAEESLALTREEILATWADHSAVEGWDWIDVGWRTMADAIEVMRRVEPASDAPRP